MRRHWRIRREVRATPDGDRRWDRAYQELLTWTRPGVAAATILVSEREAREVAHARSDLRTGLDAAAGAGTDD